MLSRTLLALSLLSSLAFAQVDVNVDTRIPIGVTPLTGDDAGLTKVLTDDLNRTLIFAATPGAGTKYTASGTVSGGTLTGQLSGGGASLLAKTYSGDGRKAAHEFADDITKALAHVDGFATSRLAAVSGGTGHKELYVLDIDGANGLQITHDNVISTRPKWSADNTRIAYTSYKSGYPDAYVITLPASRAKVAFFPGINTGASFSPDGTRLAITLSKEGTPLLYSMPSGGGSPTRLTPGGDPHAETSPCWSPDGSKIVFDSDARGSVQLYTVPSGGGTPTRLVTASGYSAEPDWSPDGSKIAFTGRSGGQFQIGVYDVASGQSSLVTTTGGQDPSWTRNSRHLVYSRAGSLWILDTVTHATAKLDNGLTQASEPAVSR